MRDTNSVQSGKVGLSIGGSLLIVILLLVVQIIFGIIAGILVFIFKNSYIEVVFSIVGYVITMIIILRINKYRLKFNTKFNLKDYFIVLFILIGYILFYDNTFEIVLSNMYSDSWIFKILEEAFKTPIPTFIAMSLVAPIFEEIFMRGIVLEQLSKKYSHLKAILISSGLFAIMHFNIWQGVGAFLIGIILGYIYIKSGSLILCIFIHFVNNTFYYINYYYPSLYKIEFNIIKLVIGILILITSLYYFNKNNKPILTKSKVI